METEWETPGPLSWGILFPEAERSMNPKVKALWVAALRSGRYTQGYDRLCTGSTWTALGVLCEVATLVNVCTWDTKDGEFFIAPGSPPDTGAFLPLVVRDWAEFKGTHPSQECPLMYDGTLNPIWRLSDLLKVDFPTLADLIDAQY